MVASLTGFGRAEFSDAKGRLTAEVKSVNNRYLQLDIHVPYGYNWLDVPLRSMVGERVFRGKVFLRLEVIDYAPTQDFVINRQLLGKLFELQSSLQKEIGRDVPVSLDGLLGLPGVVKCDNGDADNETALARIKPVVQKAIDSFLEFRNREGEKLADDLKIRNRNLSTMVKEIEQRVPQFKEKFIERFTARIKELAGRAEVDESKLGTEIALWTDRSDISEELTRLKSHLEELGKILSSKSQIGRKLDFLVQEINREANTISNKIGDLMIIQQVLEMKSEIEKIREQAQNIE